MPWYQHFCILRRKSTCQHKQFMSYSSEGDCIAKDMEVKLFLYLIRPFIKPFCEFSCKLCIKVSFMPYVLSLRNSNFIHTPDFSQYLFAP